MQVLGEQLLRSLSPSEGAPKPDPVRPRPPAARRFYSRELCPLYIFVSSHVLANVANVAPPTYPSDWLLLSRPTGLAPMVTAKMASTITLGPPGEASLHAGRAEIPEDDPIIILTTAPPFGLDASCGVFDGLEPRRRQ